MKHSDLWSVLAKTQQYISKYYASALTDESKHDQLKSYIEKYILDEGFLVDGFTDEKLINRLYSEMVEYSVLTPYLGSPDIDEINVNSWDDIVITWSDGHLEKLEEHFHTPGHAVDMGGFTMNPQGEYNKRIYLYSGKRTIKQESENTDCLDSSDSLSPTDAQRGASVLFLPFHRQ